MLNVHIPRHLLTIEDAEILKKVVLHSVATAFASIVWCRKIMTQNMENIRDLSKTFQQIFKHRISFLIFY